MAAAFVPNRGNVVWLEFTPHAGHEQTGRRPALVLSPRPHNAAAGLALFSPVASRVEGYPFEMPLPNKGP
jgi:mRNA interferase MazF